MRGLVTLPCELYSSEGEFRPRSEPGIGITPDWKWKAQKAAQLTLDYLGADGVGGDLHVDTTIPIGWGMGSSTSDVIAAIRATADGIGVALHTEEVARLAVAAETASDSIMFGDRALLFAQRDALVIEDFGAHFPCFEVIGFAAGNAVDTLGFTPAQYDDHDIERFEELRVLLRDGFQAACPERVGHVATASARINQRFLPKLEFDRLLSTVDLVGGVGLQVAHSGSVVGVLFDGDHPDVEARIEKARAALGELGFGPTWRFSTRARTP
ncbi:MAG: kinase [Actinomycetota bacterium]|nr:kinase [Actinomycetota bacterium]